MSPSTVPTTLIRPLTEHDFEAVVALDQRTTGRARRGYFEKRLAAAHRHPRRHLQLAATTPNGLAGFALARRAGGEQGRKEEVLVLESVGVDLPMQHVGLGRRIMAGVEELAGARSIHAIVTHVDWRNHAMLRFIAGAGFSLAPTQVLERAVERLVPRTEEEIEREPPMVRNLRATDLDAIARIEQEIMGHDRRDYLARKIDEVLNESAIAVSLVVEDDGFVVGHAMSRVDFGDFGNLEPTASLDTFGVKPGFSGKGLARALLTQMIDNLAILDVQRLETEVSRENFGLLGFFYRFGFGPSQRLSFQRTL
mgnify:CR=1 FL=1